MHESRIGGVNAEKKRGGAHHECLQRQKIIPRVVERALPAPSVKN
jgi:hypothetical protein